MPDPFRQMVVEEAVKLPSIDRICWDDIVRCLIVKHRQMAAKMTIIIDLPDDEVQPDHVVQS